MPDGAGRGAADLPLRSADPDETAAADGLSSPGRRAFDEGEARPWGFSIASNGARVVSAGSAAAGSTGAAWDCLFGAGRDCGGSSWWTRRCPAPLAGREDAAEPSARPAPTPSGRVRLPRGSPDAKSSCVCKSGASSPSHAGSPKEPAAGCLARPPAGRIPEWKNRPAAGAYPAARYPYSRCLR